MILRADDYDLAVVRGPAYDWELSTIECGKRHCILSKERDVLSVGYRVNA